jgi:uncharacterized RDD family membrane protein YckC
VADEQTPPPMIYGHYAGFITRFLAFSIDLVIVVVLMSLNGYVIRFAVDFAESLPFVQVTALVKELAVAATTAINVALGCAYYMGFWLAAGQTPGKRFIGVRIVRADGGRVRAGNVLRRFAGYVLCLLFFPGFLWILVDNQRQGWHDVLAGTIVIYSRPKPQRTTL